MTKEFDDVRSGFGENIEDKNASKLWLLKNPISRAGLDSNCKIPKESVTKLITIEIEKIGQKLLDKTLNEFVAASSIKLREWLYIFKIKIRQKFLDKELNEFVDALTIKSREKFSHLPSDELSSQFLNSLPDVLEM